MLGRFTVVQKITAAYLAFALFSLIAHLFALNSMHTQARYADRLVTREFRALDLARDLRTNLLAQERLEKQYLLLKDEELLGLLLQRQEEFAAAVEELSTLEPSSPLLPAYGKTVEYEELAQTGYYLLKERAWGKAKEFAADTLGPLRSSLYGGFDSFAEDQQLYIDRAMGALPAKSERAFRVTLLLASIGFSLSVPIALAIILGIHRSVRELTRATQQIAAGSFDCRIAINSKDEFGDLAYEFLQMGRKLGELEKIHLDANPLTHLPGNLAIDRGLEERIQKGESFAHLYIDLDHFKAFGDRYGYHAGSEVLARTADLIRQTVLRRGSPNDLVGHVGGDDFILLSQPETAEVIAADLIEAFDRAIPGFYSEEDREAGYFVARDRFDVERKFPLLTMSIAIIYSENLDFSSRQAFSWESAKMKEHLKLLPGSNFLINRRKKI